MGISCKKDGCHVKILINIKREVSTMYADENVIRIKHDVLHEVAKLAFAGELDSKRDHIAVELILSSAAVSTKRERLSGREFVLRKARRQDGRMTEISSK